MGKSGTQCCAFGCNKRKKRRLEDGTCRSDSEGTEDEELQIKRKLPRTFHSFPSDPERKAAWIVNMHREGWSPSVHSRICSDHFKEAVIDRTGQRVELRHGATPTRFKKFPKHLKKVTKERKPPTVRGSICKDVQQADHNIVDECPAEPISVAVQMTDHQYHIVESPRKLKAQLEQSNAEVVGLKKNLKTSQQKSRRLRRRVKSLKAIVKVAHEKLLISSGCEAMLKQTFSGGKGNCQQEDPTQLLHSFDDTSFAIQRNNSTRGSHTIAFLLDVNTQLLFSRWSQQDGRHNFPLASRFKQ